MWKVTNEINKKILRKFEAEIIRICFKIILEMSLKINAGDSNFFNKNRLYWDKIETYDKCSNKALIKYIFNKQVKFNTISNLIQEIVKKYSYKQITLNYIIYLYQNSKVNKNDYNIKPMKINDEFKIIFVDIFYEKLFNDKVIWNTLCSETYNREIFHKNFKKENDIEVCPYCDIDSTISTSNNNIEHFLPKSKFPFLSMNPYNLIPSCIACNKKNEGKGDSYYLPIVTPFNKQIGDCINYDMCLSEKKIYLNTSNQSEINYLKLLKLKKRYEDERIFKIVYSSSKAIFDTLIGFENIFHNKLDNQAVINYINGQTVKLQRKKPLTFAVKYNIVKFNEYKNLINR